MICSLFDNWLFGNRLITFAKLFTAFLKNSLTHGINKGKKSSLNPNKVLLLRGQSSFPDAPGQETREITHKKVFKITWFNTAVKLQRGYPYSVEATRLQAFGGVLLGLDKLPRAPVRWRVCFMMVYTSFFNAAFERMFQKHVLRTELWLPHVMLSEELR